jgi:hypothetical protein
VARHSIIEIGRELIAAKAECGHGNWLGWLEQEFGWHENTARNYMNVAAQFGSKSTTIVDLESPSITTAALYALASPRVPQIVRDEAVERAEAGARDRVELHVRSSSHIRQIRHGVGFGRFNHADRALCTGFAAGAADRSG